MQKFKKWREQLTYIQCIKIMVIVGVVIISLCFPALMKLIEKGRKLEQWIMAFWLFFIFEFAIEVLIAEILQVSKKLKIFKEQKLQKFYEENLRDDEFIEVIFKGQHLSEGNASNFYWDAKLLCKTKNPKWYVRLQGNQIYIILVDNTKIVKSYTIENFFFFDENFEFLENQNANSYEQDHF